MNDGHTVLTVSMQHILFSGLYFSEEYNLPLYIGKVQITQQKADHNYLLSGCNETVWCLDLESAEIKAIIHSQVLEMKNSTS